MNLVLRTRLTQNLANLSPQLRDELEYIIDTEFPSCDDWTPVKWQPFGLRIVTRLSGRAFVGPAICRQDQWMDCSINFAVHVFMACIKLQFFPEWARPWGQYLVSDLGKIRRDIAKAKELLKPVLSERLELLRRQNNGSMISENPPNDMIQWLVEALPDNEKGDVQIQAELQLIVAAAAIHTTNNLLFDCMFDLADDPQLQEELRQEAYQILEEEDGWGKKESMSKLRKLDSFMGEVQRLRGNISKHLVLNSDSNLVAILIVIQLASFVKLCNPSHFPTVHSSRRVPRSSPLWPASPRMNGSSQIRQPSMLYASTVCGKRLPNRIIGGSLRPLVIITSTSAPAGTPAQVGSLPAMRSNLLWHTFYCNMTFD